MHHSMRFEHESTVKVYILKFPICTHIHTFPGLYIQKAYNKDEDAAIVLTTMRPIVTTDSRAMRLPAPIRE